MKVIHGSSAEKTETSAFKTCPICGAICFEDMDVCFGCLHHFGEEENPLQAQATMKQIAPDPASVQKKLPALSDQEIARESYEAEQNERAEASREGAIESASRTQGAKTLTAGAGGGSNEASSKHLCVDSQGRAFEIAISIKML